MKKQKTEGPDRTAELLEQLQSGVAKLTSGEDWKRALEVQARFHNYSWNNTMLIAIQRPNATYVGGMRNLWNKIGRHVIAGEKAIWILAPKKQRVEDKETGEVKWIATGRFFRSVPVFDISQTDGEPFAPHVLAPEELEGDAPVGMYDAIADQARALGYTVTDATEGQLGSAKGRTIPSLKKVEVLDAASPLQRLKTLVHELAHAMLHCDDGYDYAGHRGIAEVEAESTAFVVCTALGLPTDDYSFAYVGGWSKGDMALVKKTGERVAKTSKAILAAFNGHEEEAA